MKVVILAGGRGTRISEETVNIPKPMVGIGGKPILWHVMKIFSHFGFNDFIVCLGYKSYMIKEYFSHYYLHMSDITIDMKKNDIKVLSTATDPWKITLVDTGLETMTGGRLKRIKKYIGNETFMMTYGDGVGDINIKGLLSFHKRHGKLATITAVQLAGRFGALKLDSSDNITNFLEKPKGDGGWINGGFFVLKPQALDYIEGDKTIWEYHSLKKIIKDNQLAGYKHRGFWKCMDTIRDKAELEELWEANNAPWKVW